MGDLEERFLDNKRVEGTIEEMVNESINFLYRNMKISVIITDEAKRINRTEYPMKAIREVIVNAIVHRDYSFNNIGKYISIFKFHDRIEITSPGGLYGTITIDDLDSVNIFDPRNPNIVRILEEKTDFFENRHTGISTMKREMREHGLVPPEFEVGRDYFKVIFRNKLLEDDPGIQQSGAQNTFSGAQNETKFMLFENSEEFNIIDKYKNMIIQFCKTPKSAKEIREYLGIKSKRYVGENVIKPLIIEVRLDYVNKNIINAKNQKYITVKGVK